MRKPLRKKKGIVKKPIPTTVVTEYFLQKVTFNTTVIKVGNYKNFFTFNKTV